MSLFDYHFYIWYSSGGNVQRFIESLPLARKMPWVGYVFAVAATLVAYFVRWQYGGALGTGFPYVTFFPAVMLTAFLFGVGPGIAAGLMCGLVAKYFYIAPVGSLMMNWSAWVAILFYSLVVFTDIAVIYLMQRANHALATEREASRNSSELKTVMFNELQHRVANKLQMIASLLSLQRRSVTDKDARKALEDAARRVGIIGRISRALYDSGGARVGVESLLRQITADICEASGAMHIATDFAIDPEATLSDDAAVPFALIFTETLSNALEHGFKGQGQGRIAVSITTDQGNGLTLMVDDDGVGPPAGFDAAKADSLGLRIAGALASQLQGNYELKTGPLGGARATLVFPRG